MKAKTQAPSGPNSDQRDVAKLAGKLKLADGVGFLVRLLSTRASLLYQELTGQEDITPRQFGALLTLYQQGSMSLTQLALQIRIDRATLSEMIRRMTERKLIAKLSNGEDRRSTNVSITAKGEATLMRLVTGAAALQGALLAPIPPNERRNFLRCMKLAAEPDQALKAADRQS